MRSSCLVSILIPFFDGQESVAASIQRILEAPLPAGVALEIVAVDDGSADGSSDGVGALAQRFPETILLARHPTHNGKGAAVRTAIELARGEFTVILDAGAQFDPAQLHKLLHPLLYGHADAVYGSRLGGADRRRMGNYWHSLVGRSFTAKFCLTAELNLTVTRNCSLAFRTDLVKTIPLHSRRFRVEPEIAIKLAQRQARVCQVLVGDPGTPGGDPGKIGFKHSVRAMLVALRHSIIRDTYRDAGARILDALAGTPHFNQWMADTIRPFVGSRVLELGAGIGNLTRHLSTRQRRYVATDIDTGHLARLRSRFPHTPNLQIECCDLTNPDHVAVFRGQMDTVICINVVEHVWDDQLALTHIASALEEGGRAIVLVPQGQSLYGTLDEALGHQRRYSEKDLRAKMERAGLRVEKMISFNRVTHPAWWVNGRLFRKRSFGRLQLWTFDRMVWFWRRIDPWLPWKPLSIIAVGVKQAK
ncbi:MAG TPA: glycosyltransferase [Bryobacteraceae bacterium]|nr:glycosyltransferase [Bryobacteraceae bacterium]